MIIKSLNTMEKIVNKNENLIWNGWDVIDLKESEIARTSPLGIRVKNKWYLHRTYSPSRIGWDIPNKYKD
jgi:hypothetical protein